MLHDRFSFDVEGRRFTFSLFSGKFQKMGLGGNLEDLGLGEILSIVGLSRKSGVLFLRRKEEEGKIVFKKGQVIYAESTLAKPNAIEILVKHNVFSQEVADRIKDEFDLSFPSYRTLTEYLIKSGRLRLDLMEKLFAPYIEDVVFRLFDWEEGKFNLEVLESDEDIPLYIDPYGALLDVGINPQFLAIEGSRRKDEEMWESASAKAERAKAEVEKERRVVEEEKKKVEVKSEFFDVTRLTEGLLDDFEIEDESEEYVVEEPEDMKRLKSYIYELHNPKSGTEISLLILRYASEIMNRAIIFLVKGKEVIGLGQFGLSMNGANAIVRSIKIPLDSPSIFMDVIKRKAPVRRKLRKEGWDKFLVQKLGGVYPEEAFAAPLFATGKIVAIIYGDNLPEQKRIENTAGFEIFLSHASLAMDRAFLERRLKRG